MARPIAALAMVVVLAPSCGLLSYAEDALSLAGDAAPASVGASVGAVFGGVWGAAIGAALGVTIDAAISWTSYSGDVEIAAKDRAIEYRDLPITVGRAWAEFWDTIVGIVVVAFLLGWLLLGPSEMLRRWKNGRRKLRHLIGLDRRELPPPES